MYPMNIIIKYTFYSIDTYFKYTSKVYY